MLTDIRLITVKEYHQMIEAGILESDERVELIAGQILKMAAKGTPHRAVTTCTWKLLEARLSEVVLVCPQEPIKLSNYSEPEPDIAVLRPDPRYYVEHHPTSSEVHLIIEIADSTLKRDCEVKANIYAQSGIIDYWVLDLNHSELHVFRDPSPDGYQSHEILTG